MRSSRFTIGQVMVGIAVFASLLAVPGSPSLPIGL